MMRDNGFIKLDRKILNWRWYNDVNTFRVFIHLLLTANYYDSEYLTHKIKRGQVVTGRKKIASALKISEQNVRSALNHLKSTNEITINSHSKFSIITIKNYNKYQQPTKKLTSNQPTTNQQLTSNQPHNKNNKNIKNSKNIHTEKNSVCESVLKLYNSICVDFPKALKLTESRERLIEHAIAEEVDFEQVFRTVQNSDFLKGKKTGWNGCNIDWILKTDNLLKIREGVYNKKLSDAEGTTSFDIEVFESKSLFND